MKQDRLAAQDRQRHATTLGELQRQGIDIFCWCNRCGHSAVAPVGVFVAQLGPSFTVPDIGAHLRCSGCDNKDIAARPAWPSLGQVTRHHDRRAAEETSKPDPPDRPGGRTPVAASSDGGQQRENRHPSRTADSNRLAKIGPADGMHGERPGHRRQPAVDRVTDSTPKTQTYSHKIF